MDHNGASSDSGVIGDFGGTSAASVPGDLRPGRARGARPLPAVDSPSLGQKAQCLDDLRAVLARKCSAEALEAGDVRDGVGAALAPLLSGPLLGRRGLGVADDTDLVWCAREVQRAINTLEGARSALAGELARRRLPERRGEANVAETLANITSLSGVTARRVERDATLLAAQPQIAETLSSGSINAEQAATMAKADVSDEVRADLCEAAKTQSADETADAVRAAEAAYRRESDAERHARQRAARRAWMRLDRRDGMWHLGATFDALTGDAVYRRLAKLIQRQWHSDKHLPEAQRRTVQQRTADALAQMLLVGSSEPGAAPLLASGSGTRSGTDDHESDACTGGARPSSKRTPLNRNDDGDDDKLDVLGRSADDAAVVAGRRSSGHEAGVAPPPTQMIVIATLDNLRDAASGVAAVTDAGTELSATQMRMLACDTQVIPAVMGGAGEILDVGRTRRTIPAALRRALIARDQKCVWPRCERPPLSCDGHHIDHWAHDGPTQLDNLALLCHTHHIKLHELNLRLIPPSMPSAPGEGWAVKPTPARTAQADRTPVSDHTRQDR